MKTPTPIPTIEKVETPVVDPVVDETPQEDKDAAAQEAQDDVTFVGNDRVPSMWNIIENEAGEIEAVNSTTGSTFLGTMAQFKACLRS